jgi:hypothetical protein
MRVEARTFMSSKRLRFVRCTVVAVFTAFTGGPGRVAEFWLSQTYSISASGGVSNPGRLRDNVPQRIPKPWFAPGYRPV